MSGLTPERRSMLTVVKSWTDRIRLWVVYASVALVIAVLYLGGFLGPARGFLLPAAMGVLIAFGVQSLQTIERQTAPAGLQEFVDVEQALGELGRLVAGDHKVTSLKVISATGRTTVHRVLPAIMTASPAPRVELEMQVVDTDGVLRDAYPRHWAEEIGPTLECLDEVTAQGRLVATVSADKFLPPIHGILVDDHFLLVGTFDWTHRRAGGSSCEVPSPRTGSTSGETRWRASSSSSSTPGSSTCRAGRLYPRESAAMGSDKAVTRL